MLEKRIFKLYIFLLPFKVLFPFLSGIRSFLPENAYISNAFFIFIVGFIFMALSSRGKIFYDRFSLSGNAINLCIKMLVISFFTSVFLFIPFGTLNGENTMTASFPSMVYVALAIFIFYYNSEMLKITQADEIKKILDILSVVMLVIGYLQLLVILVPSFAGIYDRINFLHITGDAQELIWGERIFLTGSEPASVGGIICNFIMPYLLSCILTDKKVFHIICTVLFLPILFYTFSSTVYVGFIICLAVFLVLKVKQHKAINKKILFTILIFWLVIIIILVYAYQNTVVGNQIKYFLFDKTTSDEDTSTQIRYSTVYTDIYAFLHYPLSGVGNGNQGYFYNEVVEKYIPDDIQDNVEIANRLEGNAGIVNGGAFVPSFISGYGLIGLWLAIRYIKRSFYVMQGCSEELAVFKNMYYIAFFSMLVTMAAASTLDGNFLGMFVLSIPFMMEVGG